MTEELARHKYQELVAALRDRDEAAKRLAACEKRVAELSGLATEKEQRKTSRTRTRKEFIKACGV